MNQAVSGSVPVHEARLKRFAVFAAAAGLSTWAIDMAATQVGLPSQQTALGISVTSSQWILNVTLMILAGLVTMGGALGDRIGRLRVFRWGAVVIMVGAAITFAGGLMNQYAIVLVGRGIEGIGAALFIPASTALLVDVFPATERGAAQGKMIIISMFITAFAPTLIGVIIQAVAWPFVYLLTILSAGVMWWLVGQVKYDQVKARPTPFDYAGSVLVFLAVALLTMGIMQAGTASFTSLAVLLPVGAGIGLGVALVVVSLRKEFPLIQFRLMQIRTVGIAVVVSLMRFLPLVLMGAFVSRYVQQVLGLSPTVTGMLLILPVLAQVFAAPIAGRMLDREGPRKPVSLGIGLMAAGLLFLAFGFPAESIWLVIFGTILGGAGFSFINPVQMAALTDTPIEQRGMLAGIFPLVSNFGTAFWVALLTAGLGSFMNSFMANNPGATEAAAQSSALGTLSWIGIVLTLGTLAVGLMLRKQAPGASTVMPVQASTE